MYDYVLQLGFDKKTEDYIQEIKNSLKDNDVMDKEKNWRPHITVDLYNSSNKEEFIKMIDEIVKKIDSFEVNFNNLNDFDDETLYIEPFNKEKLYAIKDLFDKEMDIYRLERRKMRVYRPHVTLCTNDDLTVARKISEDKFRPFIGKVTYLWIYNPKVTLIKEYKFK